MKTISCPYCKNTVEVEDDKHYDMIYCPECDNRFQALQDGTMSVARNFLEELKKMGIKDKDEED